MASKSEANAGSKQTAADHDDDQDIYDQCEYWFVENCFPRKDLDAIEEKAYDNNVDEVDPGDVYDSIELVEEQTKMHLTLSDSVISLSKSSSTSSSRISCCEEMDQVIVEEGRTEKTSHQFVTPSSSHSPPPSPSSSTSPSPSHSSSPPPSAYSNSTKEFSSVPLQPEIVDDSFVPAPPSHITSDQDSLLKQKLSHLNDKCSLPKYHPEIMESNDAPLPPSQLPQSASDEKNKYEANDKKTFIKNIVHNNGNTVSVDKVTNADPSDLYLPPTTPIEEGPDNHQYQTNNNNSNNSLYGLASEQLSILVEATLVEESGHSHKRSHNQRHENNPTSTPTLYPHSMDVIHATATPMKRGSSYGPNDNSRDDGNHNKVNDNDEKWWEIPWWKRKDILVCSVIVFILIVSVIVLSIFV